MAQEHSKEKNKQNTKTSVSKVDSNAAEKATFTFAIYSATTTSK